MMSVMINTIKTCTCNLTVEEFVDRKDSISIYPSKNPPSVIDDSSYLA